MISLYVDKENIKNGKIEIKDKKDIHHILNVHRIKENENLRIVDGEYEYLTKIIVAEKNKMLLEIIEKNIDEYSLNVEIDVAMAMIKNDNFNLVIQKLTEIGINAIIPIKTTNTVVKINEKKDKWDTLVLEAMKQCRAVKKTKIYDIISIKEINYEYYDKVIFVYEKAETNNKLKNILTEKDKKILFLIGPEGGFTLEEKEYLCKINNVEMINLGKRILRAETAAIYIAAVISNMYL